MSVRYVVTMMGITIGILLGAFAWNAAVSHAASAISENSGKISGVQGGEDWFCPWCGQRTQPRYIRGRAGQLEYQPGRPMGDSGQCKPLTQDRVEFLLRNYLESTQHSDWKVKRLTDDPAGGYYVADIVRQDGSQAERILINRYTGWFKTSVQH